jgi:hypothetical protein
MDTRITVTTDDTGGATTLVFLTANERDAIEYLLNRELERIRSVDDSETTILTRAPWSINQLQAFYVSAHDKFCRAQLPDGRFAGVLAPAGPVQHVPHTDDARGVSTKRRPRERS